MDTEGKPKRRASFVIPHDESETDDSSDNESVPLAKLAERYRKERENSDNEDNIPQLELRRRLNRKSETDESETKNETLIYGKLRASGMSHAMALRYCEIERMKERLNNHSV